MTEPPLPPLPPSGPPSGLNFSRWTEAQPSPPLPPYTCRVTRSTKLGIAMSGFPSCRVTPAFVMPTRHIGCDTPQKSRRM
jgi:hypothetical protein